MFKPGDRVRIVSIPRDEDYFRVWLGKEFTVSESSLPNRDQTRLEGARPDGVTSGLPFYWSTDSLELVNSDDLNDLRKIVEDYRKRGYEVKIFVTPPPTTPKEISL